MAAPVQLAPADDYSTDLQLHSVQFQWTPATAPQTAYALRRRRSGEATQYWWRRSTQSWIAGEVWNASSTSAVQLPAGAFANEESYQWAVATRATGVADSAYSEERLLVGVSSPVATITGPASPYSAGLQPTISWNVWDPHNAQQTAYQVVITQGTLADPQNPLGGEVVYNTGTITSPQQYHNPGALNDGITYTISIRVTTTQTSLWTNDTFIIELQEIEAPTIVVTAE